MPGMQEFLFKYGLPGAIIFALGWFIFTLEERHRSERKEWNEARERELAENRKIQEQQFQRMEEMNDNSNQAMRENTSILAGLKSLLEHQSKH